MADSRPVLAYLVGGFDVRARFQCGFVRSATAVFHSTLIQQMTEAFKGRKLSFGIRLAICAVGLASCLTAEAAKTKDLDWGIETWKIGQNDFVIQFKEPDHVRILRIYGNLTAAPQPNHPQFAHIIRQTIASLLDVNPPKEDDVVIVSTPADRANQSIARNMFTINVKQTDSETMNIPIEYNYSPGRVLTENKLLVRILNESYKTNPDGRDVISHDQYDALNVEIHLIVTYETDN